MIWVKNENNVNKNIVTGAKVHGIEILKIYLKDA